MYILLTIVLLCLSPLAHAACGTGEIDIGGGVCQDCPGGTTNDAAHLNCVNCPAGSSSNPGGACFVCGPGMYSPVAGTFPCQECPAGQTHNTGHTACVDCAAGSTSP
jgi:hypothetical protein